MESYIREKKEAILEDRKNEKTVDGIKILFKPKDDDQISALVQVQQKYQNLRAEAAEDARSRQTHITKTASQMARSNAPQSMAGSAALLRERMTRDFGMIGIGDNKRPAAQQVDELSTVSGLDDEIDEWTALSKYAVFRNYQENMEKK